MLGKRVSKLLAPLALLSLSLANNALASDVTSVWEFQKGNNANISKPDGLVYGNRFIMDQNDINLIVSAWSDDGPETGVGSNDNGVRGAYLSNNNSGLIAYARDGGSLQRGTRNGGFGGNGDNHYVDSQGSDTDMLLFSFDELVSLTSLDFRSVFGNATDITIAAFGGDAAPSLVGNSWATIAGSAIFKTSMRVMETARSLNLIGSNGKTQEAKHWLIGAYSSAFGGDSKSGADGIKLLALTTHSTTETRDASAPAGGLLIIALAYFGLRLRRRK